MKNLVFERNKKLVFVPYRNVKTNNSTGGLYGFKPLLNPVLKQVSPIVAHSLRWTIKNPKKLTVGLAGVTEVLASTLNGDVFLPLPPPSLDAMFLTTDLTIERPLRVATEIVKPTLVINPMEMEKTKGVSYQNRDKNGELDRRVNALVEGLPPLENGTYFTTIYTMGSTEGEQKEQLSILTSILPSPIEDLDQFRDAVIHINTILVILGNLGDSLSPGEKKGALRMMEVLYDLVDSEKKTYSINQSNFTAWKGTLPKSTVNEPAGVYYSEKYNLILHKHGDYFNRLIKEENDYIINNSSSSSFDEKEVHKRVVQENQEYISNLIKEHELATLRGEIGIVRDSILKNAKENLTSIIGRSHQMAEELINVSIPKMENLSFIAKSRLEQFKNYSLLNKNLFLGFGLATVSLAYALYSKNLLSFIRKGLGYFFLHFRKKDTILDVIKKIPLPIPKSDIKMRPTEILGTGAIATTLLAKLLKNIKR